MDSGEPLGVMKQGDDLSLLLSPFCFVQVFSTSPKTINPLSALQSLLSNPYAPPAHISTLRSWPSLLSCTGLLPLPALVPFLSLGPDPSSLGLGLAGLGLEGRGIQACCDHMVGTCVMVTKPGHPVLT